MKAKPAMRPAIALSIQAGTGSEGLCCGGGGCGRGAEEEEEEGREGLGMDARLGARGVIGEVGGSMMGEFTRNVTGGAGC